MFGSATCSAFRLLFCVCVVAAAGREVQLAHTFEAKPLGFSIKARASGGIEVSKVTDATLPFELHDRVLRIGDDDSTDWSAARAVRAIKGSSFPLEFICSRPAAGGLGEGEAAQEAADAPPTQKESCAVGDAGSCVDEAVPKSWATATFITLFSGPANVERRQTLRRTWMRTLAEQQAREARFKDLVVVKFFIGQVKSEALAADLAAEQAQHGDIVLLKEVAEGYDRLLPKQAAVFRWLQRHSQSAFVFRWVRAPTLRSAHCNCPV